MLPGVRRAAAAASLKPIYDQVEKRHGEALARLQEWIRQPSIAAESRGMTEGRDLMMKLLREAGFGKVRQVSQRDSVEPASWRRTDRLTPLELFRLAVGRLLPASTNP